MRVLRMFIKWGWERVFEMIYFKMVREYYFGIYLLGLKFIWLFFVFLNVEFFLEGGIVRKYIWFFYFDRVY